jgi:hypothetical protein
MKLEGSKASHQASDSRAGPRLGLCQILALLQESGRPGKPGTAGSPERQAAPVIRRPVMRLTWQ